MRTVVTFFVIALSVTTHASEMLSGDELEKWGYWAANNSQFSASFCSTQLSKKATLSYQGIKSIKPIPGSGAVYYRFTLIKEQYSTLTEAEERNLEVRFPTHKTSKHSKMCNLRKVHVKGSEVFIVHTDVGSFLKEQQRVMNSWKISEQSIINKGH